MTKRDGRLDQLLKILESGDFSSFVEEVEDAVFECKLAPYYLDKEMVQFELAKDVAAFANADGGAIVIGLETGSVPERAADVVKVVRPFAREHFNAHRYRALIRCTLRVAISVLHARSSHSTVHRSEELRRAL